MDTEPNAREQITPSPLLIGREDQLKKFDSILKRGDPAIVTITGEPGTGKTALLQAFEEMAEASTWRVAGHTGDHFLRITPLTDERELYSQVSAFFDSSAYSKEISDGFRFVKLDLMSQLKQWTQIPLLLLIDGYDPKPEFDSWFKASFIETVRDYQEPLVIVIADRPERIAGLEGKQDAYISLGPLSRQVVENELRSLSAKISPALTQAELEAYVEASLNNPELLDKFHGVLSLARPSEAA